MTKKRMLLIAILPLAIIVTVGVLAMLPPRPGVTKTNFDQIQEGMTKAEVEAIFGGHPSKDFQYRVKREIYTSGIWCEDNGKEVAWIEFFDGKVCDTRWGGVNESITDKIRRWLHLR